ncbi:Serine protease snake [Lucilia cuprina]|uniref:Serine protease snake n=1 Tax=Lucilia cuprina TaxID=7375 RepID=A0A0L0CL94_LUCCU|nr:Serine protease snake [Lucilia cuprina]
MNYQLIFKIFLLITNILIIKGDRHKHNRFNYNEYYSQLYPMTYDYLGNCYVDAAHHKGHCIRYQECESAVKAWEKHQQFPFTCYYYNSYDHFICCPEAFIKPKRKSTTPYERSLNSYYLYHNNPFLVNRFSNQLTAQEQRISEKECALMYNNPAYHQLAAHYHHRSKRNSNTDSEVKDQDSLEPVFEETVQKVKVSKTQAVGGVPTNPEEFPYMCALGWRKFSSKHAENSYNCGCVLIARKYVLTVAHCATLGGETPSIVRLGGVDLDEPEAEIIKIQRIIQHPDYKPPMAYNDIAIVELKKSSRYTPACLWSNVGLPQETLTAMGYGHTKFAGTISNTLLKVYLKVLTNQDCNVYYTKNDKLNMGISLGQICAGDPQGKMDTCQGDSGGPLVMNESKYNTIVPYVVGLTSFGEGCASNVPSVYTRISHFIDWIEENVWK